MVAEAKPSQQLAEEQERVRQQEEADCLVVTKEQERKRVEAEAAKDNLEYSKVPKLEDIASPALMERFRALEE